MEVTIENEDGLMSFHPRASVGLLIGVCSLVGVVSACSDDRQSDDADVGDTGARTALHPDATDPPAGGGRRPRLAISLCNLAATRQGGAGVYEVREIAQHPYDDPGHTYITYRRVRTWAGSAPKQVTNKYDFGPKGKDKYIGGAHYVEVVRGQKIGALFDREDLNGNRMKPFLYENAIFHKDGTGGYSNGDLFRDKNFSLKEIGRRVRDMYRGLTSGNGCPYDIPPASRAADPAPDAGDTTD